MTPTALYLALLAVLVVGLAVGATLLNVPPLWTAAAVLLTATLAFLITSRPPRP